LRTKEKTSARYDYSQHHQLGIGAFFNLKKVYGTDSALILKETA